VRLTVLHPGMVLRQSDFDWTPPLLRAGLYVDGGSGGQAAMPFG
jgi:hypothetical protein